MIADQWNEPTGAPETVTRDVLIVGGGPAGLSAAERLATAGLTVALVDEQPELGGQYYRRPAPAVAERWGDHRPEGGLLVERVRAAGAECRTRHTVWGVDDDGRTLLAVDGDGRPVRLRGRYLIIATGAYERVLPFPGWQLPGVATPGFAQHLAASEHTPIGERVLVAGSGPFLLPVACSLVDLGVTVVGVAEAGTPYRPRPAALGALRHPARLRELAGYVARLARARVPIWQGHTVVRAEGTDRVSSVTVAAGGDPATARTHLVDALCVGYGFRPQTDLARMLGCDVRADAVTGDATPVTDPRGRTSRPGVYVIGEAAGIGGAPTARARGLAAACDILIREGRPPARRDLLRAGAALRDLARFTELTERLFPSPAHLTSALVPPLPGDTMICRCEAVTAREIRAVAGEAEVPAPADVNAVKARTRAGMGPCQGRECGVAVAALMRSAAGRAGGEDVRTTAEDGDSALSPGVFPARTPIRPIPLRALLATETSAETSAETTAQAPPDALESATPQEERP